MDAKKKHGIEAMRVLKENERQINADERRLNESVSMYEVVGVYGTAYMRLCRVFSQNF